MEPDNSQPFRTDTPEKDPAPAQTDHQSGKRVSAYDLMVVEGDLEGSDPKNEEIHEMLDQIEEKASSVLEFSLRWEEIDEQFDLLKQRAMEVDLKEESLRKQVLELDKREERVKLVEERERGRAELIEKEAQSLEANVVGLVLQMQNEEMVGSQLNSREKLLGLLQDSMMKKHEGLIAELEAREKEVALLSKSIDEKSFDFEMKVKDFDLKQTAETERRRKEAELMEASLRELEAREYALRLLNDTIREKSAALEKKEENFQLKQEEVASAIDVKRKSLELKEKELEEREKEIELKQIEDEELSMQALTRKRSRLESGLSLVATKGRDAEAHTQHNHNNEDKGNNSVSVDSASKSSPVLISEAYEEVVSSENSDEEHEPLLCADSEFNDFGKTMRSFMAGQVWALYDSIDSMPRLYGRIKKITNRGSSLHLTWFESKDEKSVPSGCGRFKLGITETISDLTFSHVMHPIIHGRNFIAVIPRRGETWALFRDWSKSWNNNPKQHKPSYKYDFVEVLVNFDDCLGVGVAYLGKVEGFVSVYEKAGQHGVVSLMIAPEEMQRFSHRVPSFRLNGEEREGVPAGSFELDPAAIISVPLKPDRSIREEAEETARQSEDCGKTCEVDDQDGLRKDFPIILD
ncbi:nucleoprotein TPR [Capsella rubella]|nr:nucleoprotein TPR [Capsella rubella]